MIVDAIPSADIDRPLPTADYRGAIDFMMAATAIGVDELSPDPTAPFPRTLGLGLAELCTRLLQRYERLSQVNQYGEPAVTPLEHLKLLALLHDRHSDLA